MSLPDKKDCLTAVLVGLHFAKPRYGFAARFPTLVDTFVDEFNDDVEVLSITSESLKIRFEDIYISLSAGYIMIHSAPLINTDISVFFKKNRDGKMLIPVEFYSREILDSVMPREGNVSKLEKSFIKSSSAFVEYLDSLLENGIPLLKFMGFVKYYLVPLEIVSWRIMNKFNDNASIPGAVIRAKSASNLYSLPDGDDGLKKKLLFSMNKLNDSKIDISVVSARFDFQYWPPEPQSVGGFGKSVLLSMSKDLDALLEQTGFMDFEPSRKD